MNSTKKSINKSQLIKSMALSTISRPIGMIVSLIYTPVLLNYLGEESYGLWSTILSIINWVNYFDVGIGNGLRNILTEEIESDSEKEANASITTGYAALSIIASTVMAVGSIIIFFINTYSTFNTTINIKPALEVSFICICINFVLALSKVQLYAIHEAEKVGFMTVLTQALNLIGILVLSTFSKGSIIGVAIIVGLSGIVVNIIYTKGIWKRYNYLKPQKENFDKRKLNDICNIGIKFFVIQISALVLYSTDNIIITRLFGPERVTPYHTVYAAFGIINGIFSAFMAPLWAKYTVALCHNDYKWIRDTVIRLDKFLPLISATLIIGSLTFEPISKIWLHKTLFYDHGLIICMAVYYIVYIWGSIYANAMNGIGRVNLQLVMSVIGAIANIPLSIYFGKYCSMGDTGVCLATVICLLITEVVCTIDLHRYLNIRIHKNFRNINDA